MPAQRRLSGETVLAVARELLEQLGRDGLGMRPLARRLGVKAPSLYFHVESRQDILLLLTREGREELRQALEAARPGGNAGGRAHALADTYVAFASANPGLFALMFEPGQADAVAVAGADTRVADAFRTALREERGLAEAVWALVHGFACLRLHYPEDSAFAPERLHEAVDRLLADPSGAANYGAPGFGKPLTVPQSLDRVKSAAG